MYFDTFCQWRVTSSRQGFTDGGLWEGAASCLFSMSPNALSCQISHMATGVRPNEKSIFWLINLISKYIRYVSRDVVKTTNCSPVLLLPTRLLHSRLGNGLDGALDKCGHLSGCSGRWCGSNVRGGPEWRSGHQRDRMCRLETLEVRILFIINSIKWCLRVLRMCPS